MNLQNCATYFRDAEGFKAMALISPKGKIVDHNIPLTEAALKSVLKKVFLILKGYPKTEQKTATLSINVSGNHAFYHPVPSGAFLFYLQNENGVQQILERCKKVIEDTKTSPPAFRKEFIAPHQRVLNNSNTNAPVLKKKQVNPAVKPNIEKGVGLKKLVIPKESPSLKPGRPPKMNPSVAPARSPTISPEPTPAVSSIGNPANKPRCIKTELDAEDSEMLILSLQDGYKVVGGYTNREGRFWLQLSKQLA